MSRPLAALFLATLCLVTAITVYAEPIRTKPRIPQPKPTDERPQEVLDAIKRFESGDPAAAFGLLQEAVAAHPELPPARVMFANFYLTEKQFAPGRAELEKAVLEHPSDPEPRLTFGDLALLEQRLSDAEAQYRLGGQLLAKFQGDAKRKLSLGSQYRVGLAMVAEKRGDFAAAEKPLRELLAEQPKNALALQRLGGALTSQGKTDEALKVFRSAVALDPSLPPAEMMVGHYCLKIGQRDLAVQWYEKAIAAAPREIRAYQQLINVLIDDEQLDKARQVAEQGLKQAPDSLELKTLAGAVARFQGDLAAAEPWLEEVLQNSPGDVTAANQLALILIESEDKIKQRRALELATVSLRKAPQNSTAMATLGWIQFRSGNQAEAEKLMKQALAGGSPSRDVAYQMARVMHASGNNQPAMEMLAASLKAKGPFASFAAAKAWQKELARR